MKRTASAPAVLEKSKTRLRPSSRKKTFPVFAFRWLKKALAGKSRAESLDLLDQWILKKRLLGLFL